MNCSSPTYCLRWVEHNNEISHHWYLRRLSSDQQFWGYVHHRSNEIQTNQSFRGKFNSKQWELICTYLERIESIAAEQVHTQTEGDMLILKGNTGEGKILMSHNSQVTETTESTRPLRELIECLQPIVTQAAERSR